VVPTLPVIHTTAISWAHPDPSTDKGTPTMITYTVRTDRSETGAATNNDDVLGEALAPS